VASGRYMGIRIDIPTDGSRFGNGANCELGPMVTRTSLFSDDYNMGNKTVCLTVSQDRSFPFWSLASFDPLYRLGVWKMKKIGVGLLILISAIVLFLDYTYEFGIVNLLGDFLVIFIVIGILIGAVAACK